MLKRSVTLILAILTVVSFALIGCSQPDIKPYIGENGNWWIGEEDLGVKAEGEQGPQGDKGDKGEDGRGILRVQIVNGELIITFTDGTTHNAGKLTDDGESSGPISDSENFEFDGEIKDYDTTLRILFRVSSEPTAWGNYDIVYNESDLLTVSEVRNAIKKRNDQLEKDMGVTITQQIVATNVYEAAFNGLYMGRDQYDIILPKVSDAAKFAHSGFLLSTDDLTNMNTEKGFYDQRAFEQLSINQKSYIIFSDITVANLDALWIYYFNHNLINEYHLDDPYQLLNDNKWTIDKLIEMCEVATKDIDGTPTTKDDWGIVGNEYVITSLYYGTGEAIVGHDKAGDLSITVNTPRVLEFVNKAVELRNYWARYQLTLDNFANDTAPYGFTAGDGYPQLIQTYTGGRALFTVDVLATARDLVSINQELNIGILPSPMLNEEQGEYFTPVNTVAACTVVPYTAESIAADLSNIIEYWAYLSHGTVYDAYRKHISEYRFSKDPIPLEVIDTILNAASYDLGSTMGWGNLETELTALIWDGGTDLSAMYDRCGGAAESELNKFMEMFVG